MSQSFGYGAEPFQGFTEFDEMESSDEFDEFGQPEFGDFESFETDFEFEPEEERGRAAGGRAPARAGGPARAMGARGPGRGAPGRPQRPGMRQARGMRGPGAMKRPGVRGPGAMRARGGTKRPGTRPPGMRRPGIRPPGPRPWRRRWLYPYAYPGYVIRQPVELPIDAYPMVGHSGNWFRSGNEVILLLDDDSTPLDQGAAAAPPEGAASAPPEGAGAPPEGAAGASGGTPPPEGGGADAAASGSEGELSGRGGLSRYKLSKIQKALNHLMGIRLEPHGLSNPQTRNALRSYQQQKGLVPHGQADYETESELVNDIADSMRSYEMEFGSTLCVRECDALRRQCMQQGRDSFDCFFEFIDCISTPTLRRGSTDKAVRKLQARLNARGATPQLTVDGIFGPKTDAAVRAFQRSRGLVVDGIVGPQTWGALGCS